MILQVERLLEDDGWSDSGSVRDSPQLPPVSGGMIPDGTADVRSKKVDWSKVHEEQRRARQRIVLWRQPFLTLVYFTKELQIEVAKAVRRCSVCVERTRMGCGCARRQWCGLPMDLAHVGVRYTFLNCCAVSWRTRWLWRVWWHSWLCSSPLTMSKDHTRW